MLIGLVAVRQAVMSGPDLEAIQRDNDRYATARVGVEALFGFRDQRCTVRAVKKSHVAADLNEARRDGIAVDSAKRSVFSPIANCLRRLDVPRVCARSEPPKHTVTCNVNL